MLKNTYYGYHFLEFSRRDATYGLFWDIEVQFYIVDNEVSIEQYLLDGDNISREELAQKFGEGVIEDIEAEIEYEALSGGLVSTS